MKRLFSWLKWLYPGMRVKRWMSLTLLGIVLVVAGIVLAVNVTWGDYLQYLDDAGVAIFRASGMNISEPKVYLPMGFALITLGLLLIFVSYFQFNRSILASVAPDAREDLARLRR